MNEWERWECEFLPVRCLVDLPAGSLEELLQKERLASSCLPKLGIPSWQIQAGATHLSCGFLVDASDRHKLGSEIALCR